MRWPWRRGRGELSELTLPYARAVKIGRARWRVELGTRGTPGCDPLVVDFWGTAEQVLAYLQAEDEDFRRIRREAAQSARRAFMIKKTHESGRHYGSMRDCPRCRQMFGKLGREIF